MTRIPKRTIKSEWREYIKCPIGVLVFQDSFRKRGGGGGNILMQLSVSKHIQCLISCLIHKVSYFTTQIKDSSYYFHKEIVASSLINPSSIYHYHFFLGKKNPTLHSASTKYIYIGPLFTGKVLQVQVHNWNCMPSLMIL